MYELNEEELMIIRRALEIYSLSDDAPSYKTKALKIRNKISNWYIDAIVSS